MAFPKCNDENKQHINLSNHAMSTLINDMRVFQIDKRSTFINRIISNFRIEARSTLSLSLQEYRNSMKKKLSKVYSSTLDTMLDELTENYKNEILDRYSRGQKKNGFKIRLNNDNAIYLFEECEEEPYYNNAGEYIKALLEEYAQKDFVDREMVYAADYFDTINDAISKGKILSLEQTDGIRLKLCPYTIATDPLSMYHYLVGIVKRTSSNSPIKEGSMYSCRISNMKKGPHCLQEKSFISKKDKDLLDKSIQKKGVQFLNQDIGEIRIRLTDKGIRMYERILHLRPKYEKIEEDGHVYTFLCSKRQIEYYFLKFGQDAVIISPEDLKKSFLDSYEKAVNAYK